MSEKNRTALLYIIIAVLVLIIVIDQSEIRRVIFIAQDIAFLAILILGAWWIYKRVSKM